METSPSLLVISDGSFCLCWCCQQFQTAKWQGIDNLTALIAKRRVIDNPTPKLEDSEELWKVNQMELSKENSMELWKEHSMDHPMESLMETKKEHQMDD